MQFLQSLLDGTNVPVLSAFILGIMTAISPCPMATNITAIGFISRELEDRRRIFINGLWYTLGRALSYTSLGVVLYFGASKFHIARFFQSSGDRFLGPLLVVVGILMLDFIPLKFPGLGKFTERRNAGTSGRGWWNAMLLGIVFALAFCPYSGVLYFGMLIPITIGSASGLLLPPVFAVATGLPVIVIAWLLAFSITSIGGFYDRMKLFEKWFRRIVASAFIIVGSYYIYLFYITP